MEGFSCKRVSPRNPKKSCGNFGFRTGGKHTEAKHGGTTPSATANLLEGAHADNLLEGAHAAFDVPGVSSKVSRETLRCPKMLPTANRRNRKYIPFFVQNVHPSISGKTTDAAHGNVEKVLQTRNSFLRIEKEKRTCWKARMRKAFDAPGV